MQIRTLAVALAALALPFTAACSSDGSDGGTGTPSKEKLAKLFRDETGANDAQADCAAEALIEAGITEEDLSEALKDASDADLSPEKEKAFTDAVAPCAAIPGDAEGS